jgi:CheY-like chemotaxis protein
MRIVIVDDTPINVTLMEALIRKIPGCEPVCFTESVAGLEWCIAHEPDLVIVDYMMPAPDGIEFIQRLRQVRERDDVPILMVTADHEKEVRYRALENGATDFLTKPVDRIEFTSRVKNMLAIRRSHLLLADRAASLSEEVRQATAAGADYVLLDNMTTEQLRAAVGIVAGRAKTEASGGVTLATVRAIAETGVDFISVGALTHSAAAVDLGLDFECAPAPAPS